jgi:hypothetical protein
VSKDQKASVATSTCTCGFPAGREACQELFTDVSLRVRALAWTGSLQTWRLMHDVYSIQHEEQFCGRWRGLVMHLGGVCWALEHNGSERGYRALQKLIEKDLWKHDPYPPAPGIPASRGQFTASVLKDLDQPALLIDGVDKWARSAWLAYRDLQPLAREWVKLALTQ